MDSLYDRRKSRIFSAALKVLPDAERLVEREKKLYVEDVEGNVLAEVLRNGEFLLNQNQKVA